MQFVDRRTYRAKTPVNVDGFVNDRTIVHINSSVGYIQYDGPTVRRGWHKPVVTREQFEEWASHDVTEQLPAGCYMTWAQYLQNKQNQKLGIG